MKLTGDSEGIVALKAIHKKNPGAMKALIEDARTTTDRATYFRDEVSGQRYKLGLDPATGDLIIDRAVETRTPPPYKPE